MKRLRAPRCDPLQIKLRHPLSPAVIRARAAGAGPRPPAARARRAFAIRDVGILEMSSTRLRPPRSRFSSERRRLYGWRHSASAQVAYTFSDDIYMRYFHIPNITISGNSPCRRGRVADYLNGALRVAGGTGLTHSITAGAARSLRFKRVVVEDRTEREGVLRFKTSCSIF
ncbi:hypothetical protein EVAR_11576_1 [Eumeta japonica]|uniref:Uncharacterized protein n=1 Tax=Eumeta variegata TaxID=151549 RepID=A0A4C1X3J7_EUMVA|nr:hypothetical protein EVAR_11576_1 [Eumeta japonica]